MAHKTNSFERFWKELKRRKVFSVVTTYAATAYIIIEVTNNLVEPLSLPAWIAKLVILLLGAGLPVVIILSWIFDFTPQGIKKTESLEELDDKKVITKPVKRQLRASYVLNAVLIIAVIILAYPKIFKRDTLERLRSSGEKISVAVMPFQNMTNDTIWNVWQDAIQDRLISSLANTIDLRVTFKETLDNFVKTKGLTGSSTINLSSASSIAKKLETDIFINGSIKMAASKIILGAQLIDTKSNTVFKSFDAEGPSTEINIIRIADSLSQKLINFLAISKLIKENPGYGSFPLSTHSPQALRYFIYGDRAMGKFDLPNAIDFFSKAIDADSNFFAPMGELAMAYYNSGMANKSRTMVIKLYGKIDQMSELDKLRTNQLYARFFQSPEEQIKYLKQLQEIDRQGNYHYTLAITYNKMNQPAKAISEMEKSLEISRKWGKEFLIGHYAYPALGEAYHRTGQYKKEKKLYREARRVNDDQRSIYFSWIIRDQASLALTLGDTAEASRYIKELLSVLKENSFSEAEIAHQLAVMYKMAGNFDKAEEYVRKELLSEPQNTSRINNLALFLIDTERNLREGLELTDKALVLRPDNYNFLYIQRQGII